MWMNIMRSKPVLCVTYETGLLKRLIFFVKMKIYHDFMFFRTMLSSFKGFKCFIQKLEDTKKIAGNLSDPRK